MLLDMDGNYCKSGGPRPVVFGWTCRISENFYGKGPDFKEMGVLVCLRFVVISYTVT
jgi:hypothetical protein